jgi:division protein CdvB (Snf7/Vps24/ESCRT-III family)
MVIEFAVLGGLLVAALNYRFLMDEYTLATYKPAPEIATMAQKLDLTSTGLAALYRSKPQIDSKAAFNKDCGTTKNYLELGCFDHGRIYILRIQDSRLAPEMQVVMAHEMLHAAWSALPASDVDGISKMIQAAYKKINDADLRQRMASYAKTEAGQESNELHSILATEFRDLPADLEKYYGRYFNDRLRVLVAHKAFEKVFDDRRQELGAQLANIKALKEKLTALNSQMDTLKSENLIAQYNALVPSQNSLVDTINGLIDDYTKGVDEFNALSDSLNSLPITDTVKTVK